MTRLLEKTFTEASKLNSQEQNLLAQWLLELLASEQRWEALFENPRRIS